MFFFLSLGEFTLIFSRFSEHIEFFLVIGLKGKKLYVKMRRRRTARWCRVMFTQTQKTTINKLISFKSSFPSVLNPHFKRNFSHRFTKNVGGTSNYIFSLPCRSILYFGPPRWKQSFFKGCLTSFTL